MNEIQKKRLFAIFEEIQRYVKFFQNPPQNTNYKGYFIEFNSMENFKKKILYEEIKNLSSSIQFSQLNLNESPDFNRINDYIAQTKFESKKDLIKELNNNNKYYLIPDSLWNKICKKENKDEKGITFYIKDNKINIEFNNNEKISFNINKGIIEKSNIIEENINTQRSNNAYKNTYKIQIDANKSNAQTFSNIAINEYSCPNCKSDIELESIKFNGEKNEELMTFKCTGNCGTQIITIKNYIEQFFKNTYLFEKCLICQTVQKNENKNFIFCINCKNIYCDTCKKIVGNCIHDKFIYINEMKRKCLIHGKDITAYCFVDKKNLCEECFNNSSLNEHSNHKKVYMDKILSPILSDEEILIFLSIMEYIKQAYYEEYYINKKNQIIEKYQRQKKEINKRENSFLNKIDAKNKNEENELKEKFSSKLKNLADNIIKELSSSLINLNKPKIEFDTLNNFFIFLDKMKQKYLEIIKNYNELYIKYVKDNKDLIDKEKNSIESLYKNIRIKIKNDTDDQLQKLKESYENEKSKIKETDIELERLNELILYSYKSNESNYYMAKNMYNLMSIYYNNKGIYLNVIQKKINDFENKKDLLFLIEKKKYIPFDDFISSTIRRDFFEPTFMGLKHINSLPFMNPILQCFTQIEKIVNFFKYGEKFKDMINSRERIYLSHAFKYLIENLWPTNDTYINNNNFHKSFKENYFSPYVIRDRLIKMNESLDPKNRNSPKDLIIFIILTLHKELNSSNINTILNSINNNIIQQIDEKNRAIMMSNYATNFARENLSIISDIFYAMKEINIKCDKCRTIKYKFQTFFYLDFQLDEILKNKLGNSFNNSSNRLTLDIEDNNINNNLINDQIGNYTMIGRFPFINELNIVDIYDCFKLKKTQEQKMYCDTCKDFAEMTYNSRITFTPEIMIIFLNRYEKINSQMKFNFYEDLNIEKYIDLKEYGCCYKLIGVIISLNGPDKNKHFIAFCRSPIDQKWYKYDDSNVSLVRNADEEIFKNNIPNILFYQKNNNIKF